jgi:hypothetical protein
MLRDVDLRPERWPDFETIVEDVVEDVVEEGNRGESGFEGISEETSRRKIANRKTARALP